MKLSSQQFNEFVAAKIAAVERAGGFEDLTPGEVVQEKHRITRIETAKNENGELHADYAFWVSLGRPEMENFLQRVQEVEKQSNAVRNGSIDVLGAGGNAYLEVQAEDTGMVKKPRKVLNIQWIMLALLILIILFK